MRRTIVNTTAVVMMTGMTATAAMAQTPRQQTTVPSRADALLLKESRYQIGQIERVLEGAVEHGATLIRDRMRAIMPADMLLSENARARGFRLDGYGVFFDVQVPSLEGTLPWVFQTLDQNDLQLDDALRMLKSYVQASAGNNADLQQAFKRIELQVAPAVQASGTAADQQSAAAVDPQSVDPILKNPNDAYRTAIREALIDAMLEHTRGLGIGPTEVLTVAARGSDDRPRLAPADPEGQTVLISVTGADLQSFLAGEITRDEAVSRLAVRVF
jgi:exonuclease VII small subunit